jgi:glutamate dehydrogenase (NADP+)
VRRNALPRTVSYFEWVQNRGGYAWPLEEVRSRLADLMTPAFDEVWNITHEEKRGLREADVLALRRIDEAVTAHGTREYFRRGR